VKRTAAAPALMLSLLALAPHVARAQGG